MSNIWYMTFEKHIFVNTEDKTIIPIYSMSLFLSAFTENNTANFIIKSIRFVWKMPSQIP